MSFFGTSSGLSPVLGLPVAPPAAFSLVRSGARKESRTPDLRITNALLYQLSYPGKASSVAASNDRPTVFERGLAFGPVRSNADGSSHRRCPQSRGFGESRKKRSCSRRASFGFRLRRSAAA